jgi:hypothetical protein
MDLDVLVKVKIRISEDWPNVHEILRALKEVRDEFVSKLGNVVLEQYQEEIRTILCTPCGSRRKKGLGSHPQKDGEGRCRGRTFRKAGYWSETRELRTDIGEVEFRVGEVECRRCGKKFSPLLGVLGLESHQRKTEGLLKLVSEAIAETSYRRASKQLEGLSGVPVPKTTAHRWAAGVDVDARSADDIFAAMADGTGFKKRGGRKGHVRIVIGLTDEGELKPLGVWAATGWEHISKDVRRRLRGESRPELLVTDGEQSIEKWLTKIAKRHQRCHWHFVRDSGFELWRAGVSLKKRRKVSRKLRGMVGIEIPEEDVESVSAKDRAELLKRVESSKEQLRGLIEEFQRKRYEKAAAYLSNASEKLFSHLDLWLETGLIGPRTTSIIEGVIRELVRRLKKLGWNWSDPGAERMGRMVIMRRYDVEGWTQFWQNRLDLRGRCDMRIVECHPVAA